MKKSRRLRPIGTVEQYTLVAFALDGRLMRHVKAPWLDEEVEQRILDFRTTAKDRGLVCVIEDTSSRLKSVNSPKQQIAIRKCLSSVAKADGQLNDYEQSVLDILLGAFPD